MILQKIWSYITFRKQPEFQDEHPVNDEVSEQDPDAKAVRDNGSYLKMMHGINRISILMFLIGMIIVIIKIFK